MEKLAIHGGPKVRTRPFSKRRPFGGREEELLTLVMVFSFQWLGVSEAPAQSKSRISG